MQGTALHVKEPSSKAHCYMLGRFHARHNTTCWEAFLQGKAVHVRCVASGTHRWHMLFSDSGSAIAPTSLMSRG
jgi:hypothetical protein